MRRALQDREELEQTQHLWVATVNVLLAAENANVPEFVFIVSARPALFTPVPPYVEFITAAFQVPAVTVPIVAISVPTNLDAAILPANIPLVTFAAPIVDVAPDAVTSPAVIGTW